MPDTYNKYRKPVTYWTKERVDNGLRRFQRDLFPDEKAKSLPQRFNTYRKAVPNADRRRDRQLRLYPPPKRVLMHYTSFVDAWESLGYELEFRSTEYWTRDEIVRGLKRFYEDFKECPLEYHKYHEKAKFAGRYTVGGVEKTDGAYNKYPSAPTILKYFRSMRNAWTAAGYDVDQHFEPWSPDEDWFILESVGVLPRSEVAEFLKRTEPAIKRRLYDLGRNNSRNRWGIPISGAAAKLGLGEHVLRKYINYGIIPYFRGNKCFYLNPADLLKIKEIDWASVDEKSELGKLIKRAIVQRALAIITYGSGWREREIYKFNKTKEPYQRAMIPRKALGMVKTLPSIPNGFKKGDEIQMKRRFKMIAAGRKGIIKATFFSPQKEPQPGFWVASVEFPKLKRFTSERPESVPYTVPVDYFERVELPPRARSGVPKKIHSAKNGAALCRQNTKGERFKIEISTDKDAVNCRMCVGILTGRINLARFTSREDLPKTAFCLKCETEKPIAEIVVVFMKQEKLFRIRPRCKECHNALERGKRRPYKRKYLRNWRAKNPELTESYWKDDPNRKEKARTAQYRRFTEKHEAILIQGRVNRHGGKISTAEAEELLEKFGRCYPTPQGLTIDGKRECEKIRSRFRSQGKRAPRALEIRKMVYEDDNGTYTFVIRPEDQPEPYQIASNNLKQWHRRRRPANAAIAD